MVTLLDVNLLIALTWPNHVHHELARRWFEHHHHQGWATCPATQSGFVRVSANHRVIPEARSPQESLMLLSRIVSLPGHEFWTDDISLADSELVARRKLLGYQQVTDAHLLAVALRHEGRLGTLDKGLLSLVPDAFAAEDVVCLVTASEDAEGGEETEA